MEAQPVLDAASSIALNCWRDLDASRPQGYGPPGPIPYEAIELWTRANALDRDWLHLLVAVIHRLDIERAERIESEMRIEEAKARHRR